jgi:plasmid stabilization system protein ParE
MTRIVLSEQVKVDFERIFEFLFEHAADTTVRRIQEIVAAIDILQASPKIGRPVALGQRELVISKGGGYLALYRYDPIDDIAYVLAVKSQRERDYKT